MNDIEREKRLKEIAKEIYNLSVEMWFMVSPHRNTNRGYPGMACSYNEKVSCVISTICVLGEVKEGLMEEQFPKLKEVRKEQEAYWDCVDPGIK